MKGNYRSIINELRKIYLNCNFEIKEDKGSIKLLCSDKKIAEDEEYLDKVCELALKYLNYDEQNVFCSLYDFFNEMTVVADNTYPNYIDSNYSYNLEEKYCWESFESIRDMGDIAA